jgi:hypothetical protein
LFKSNQLTHIINTVDLIIKTFAGRLQDECESSHWQGGLCCRWGNAIIPGNPVILLSHLYCTAFYSACLKPNIMVIKAGDKEALPDAHGFPRGDFLLHSVSSGRLLDVSSDSVQDGTPMILLPEKDNSLVESK